MFTVLGRTMTTSGSTPAENVPLSPAAADGSGSAFNAMVYGALSFGIVSVIAYSIWAFRLIPGTAAMYSATAAVYLGLSGLALSRLVPTPGAWKRFPFLFAASFMAYAICWCAFWFGLKGKFHADLWGAAVGLAVMTWILHRSFGTRARFLPHFAVLFTCHTLGYTLGDELYAAVRGTNGRLLWGAAHGLGFGAGLGYLLFHSQFATQKK
jgi:hypothetical protein